MSIYRVYNEGELGNLACGQRSVIALAPGRKWIVVVDWTTLETAKIEVEVWQRLRPEPQQFKARKVLRAMRERLVYVEPTQAIKDAIALVQAA